ncbi:hypothetical protein A2229_00465 [Candidatus Peregrinibacteria bacterium RIFOXYA2_FULL_33_7]|nr:MAG: hypothetical protein A2229_00465 [Candidatus Peregrinibacteria bacterium RIFOXYA2_FULL_33_7]
MGKFDTEKIISECLKAAAYGPFFIDEAAGDDKYWEIHTIFGLDIDELKKIADKYPDVNQKNESVKLAINNSLNNLLGYPHQCTEEQWDKYISVKPDKLYEIFKKWRKEN